MMSIDEIKQLDNTECILLVEEIRDSITKEQEHFEVSEDEKEVLDTRLALLEENPNNLMSWDEIKSKLSA